MKKNCFVWNLRVIVNIVTKFPGVSFHIFGSSVFKHIFCKFVVRFKV